MKLKHIYKLLDFTNVTASSSGSSIENVVGFLICDDEITLKEAKTTMLEKYNLEDHDNMCVCYGEPNLLEILKDYQNKTQLEADRIGKLLK